MAYDEKNIRWLLVTLLQNRKLPWQTTSLIMKTIQADSAISRYSSHRKKNWSDEQWTTFLEEHNRIVSECRPCVDDYYVDHNLEDLNRRLDKVSHGLVELDMIGTPEEDSYLGQPPSDVRSISWLLRMFTFRTNIAQPKRRYAADERAYALRNTPAEDRPASCAEEYDRLYHVCQNCMAAFLEHPDRAALDASLEKIRMELEAMTLLQ
jgi:hypothetical protein